MKTNEKSTPPVNQQILIFHFISLSPRKMKFHFILLNKWFHCLIAPSHGYIIIMTKASSELLSIRLHLKMRFFPGNCFLRLKTRNCSTIKKLKLWRYNENAERPLALVSMLFALVLSEFSLFEKKTMASI